MNLGMNAVILGDKALLPGPGGSVLVASATPIARVLPAPLVTPVAVAVTPATTAVANVVAGIVITYTRAFKTGDHVRLSETEGKIIERTAFVTRIRTPKNVEVSIPNSSIMSDKVINYSSQA